MESLRGTVAIVGAADTEVGVVPHLSATQLYVKMPASPRNTSMD